MVSTPQIRVGLISFFSLALLACGESADVVSSASSIDGLEVRVADAATISEADGSIDFSVTFNKIVGEDITVNFATRADSATAGDDFEERTGSLTIPAGATSGSITVNVLDDLIDEPDETFFIDLTGTTGGTLASGSAAVTITDDDVSPRISALQISTDEGTGATPQSIAVPIELSLASAYEVRVDYETLAQSAETPADFTATSGTLIFAPGDIMQAVNVDITGDSLDEVDETFQLRLFNPVRTTIGSSAQVTIVDDDGQPSLTLANGQVVEGDAGTVDMVFDATLSNVSANVVAFDFATVAGTALAGIDFTADTGQVSITAGQQTAQFVIAVIGDTVEESDETFSVSVSNVTGAQIAQTSILATIIDDDTPVVLPELSVADLSVAEGSGATTTADVTVTLSAVSQQDVSGSFALIAGSAEVVNDFVAASGIFTIAAGDTQATIPVQIIADTIDEPDETLRLMISQPVNAVISTDTATITITDDDAAPSISASDVSVAEGDSGTSPLTVELQLSSASAFAVSVDYTSAAQSATAGSDFTSTSGTATFPAGATSQSIAIDIVGDAVAEGDETFELQLTNPINASLANTRAIVTIQNDDGVPALTISDASVVEGDSGTQSVALAVTLNIASGVDISFEYSTVDGSAIAGSDYVAVTGVSQTIPAGDTTATINIEVAGDLLVEPQEAFSVQLSNPQEVSFTDAIADIVITDNDTLPLVSVSSVSIVEGDSGSAFGIIEVQLSAITGGPVDVDYATSDGTATAGSDYQAASSVLTIDAGSTLASIEVPIFGDLIDEADQETFTVTLSNPVGAVIGTASAIVSIDDDDAAPTLNQFGSASSNEGDGKLSFELRLDQPSGKTITVDFASADGTATSADYSSASGALSFAPGETSQSVDIALTDDALDEADETILLNLTTPDANVILGAGQLSGLIIDNDGMPSLSVLGIPPSLESAGNHVFTVRLSNAAAANVTVDFVSSDGSAIAPSDYSSVSGTLTFIPGDLEETILVPLIDDSLDEAATETMTLTLSNANNASISVASATGEIQDNDAAVTVTVVAGPSVAEGNTGTGTSALPFEVQLSAVSGLDVSVGYSTTAGTAAAGSDYQSDSGSLTIPAGDTTAIVNVNVIGDVIDEDDETVILTLSNPVNATLVAASSTGTINDDDAEPSLSIAPASITEPDGGITNLTFSVSLDAASARIISVDYSSSDGSAVAGNDYTAASGTLTFVPGDTSESVTVSVIGDTLFEGDETLTVTLSNPQNSQIATAAALGTIVENDTQPTLSLTDAGATEGDVSGGSVSMLATLSNASALTVTASYASADTGSAISGDDYTAVTGTLTFAPGDTSETIVIPLIGDTTDESDETFAVTLSAIQNALAGTVSATGTIIDDDASPSLSIGDAQITELDAGSTNMTFSVTLSAASAQSITVTAATESGTAISDTDFAQTSVLRTFDPGVTSAVVTVPVIGDVIDEVDETFLVQLSGATNATISDSSATGTIIDDDTAPSLSIATAAVTEGNSGTASLTFNVSLDAESGQEVTVDFASSDATAEAGTDYQSGSGTVVFAAGQTLRTAAIDVNGDVVFEGDETLTVTLSNAANATIASASADGTIANDDSAPAASISDFSIAEGDSGTSVASVSLTLSNPSQSDFTVDYATSDGTALQPADYISAAGSVIVPALGTSTTIPVSIVGDTDEEGSESFVLTISNPVGGAISSASATITINDDDAASQSGLSSRPSNTTCIAPDQPTSSAGISISDPYPSLPSQSQMLQMLKAPGDDSRWYIVRRTGEIRRFTDSSGASSVSSVVNLSSLVNSGAQETGLLGMAFHPDFQSNGEVYISYTRSGSGSTNPYTSVISRFTSSNGGDTIDSGSEEVLLTLDQRYSNHNGGNIAFGPDGYLYIGFGDSGSSGDPQNRSQNTTNLHGAIARIDVDGSAPYDIPSDNPFASEPRCSSGGLSSRSEDCPEIYAWGLRNPWRWSFDTATGELWLGDVGQNAREEVNRIELGGNYGWRIQEGTACFNPSSGCNTTGLVQPIVDYSHSLGQSITGGFVYRGTAIPELIGQFIFGDFASGRIFAVSSDGEGNYERDELRDTSIGIASFAQDEDGELYILNYGNGRINKIVAGSGSSNDTIPTLLSQTGCVDSGDITLPASGLIPYETIARFWSDDALKGRHYAIPDGTQIDVDTAGDGDWDFPSGSVIVKDFELAGKRIETRLFMRHTNGEWAGYTYEWNDAETDATRVIGGKTRDVNGQTWIYPSESECMQCHTAVAGYSLGLENAQLNKDLTYPSSGLTGNQLVTADTIDVIIDDLGDVSTLPTLADPTDTGETLDDRARAYLHTNCSQCHQPGGPTPTNMDLRWDTALQSTNTCEVDPTSGDLGLSNPKILDPGDASNSMLVVRINRRDVHGMPPIGSNIVDSAGVSLLSSWINGLSVCP